MHDKRSAKPDIAVVLRAVAVIPEELRPEEFRTLLFDAAEAIDGLRASAVLQDRAAVRDAETIEGLRTIISAYKQAIKDDEA